MQFNRNSTKTMMRKRRFKSAFTHERKAKLDFCENKIRSSSKQNKLISLRTF